MHLFGADDGYEESKKERASVRMRTWLRRGLAVPLAAAVIGGSVGPATADHEVPFDGPQHEYGEMVDYPLVFPVAGEPWFEDWFGASRLEGPHHAQDLFAPKGTPVHAAASGTVVRINSSWTSPTENADGCCSIVIVHDDGWSTLYVHLDNDTPGTDDGAGWGIAP
ncbi:MAG TPA: M23 family metallopeptidase, partial [Acidimicrobiia bacterium]|nr:M23 family metallopeptidase [Acidimicrobiia bacterium]